MDESTGVRSAAVYRPRRPHKKSKNGCLRCKQRKTKCDEATPRCSRCAKRDLCCQYQKNESESGSRYLRSLAIRYSTRGTSSWRSLLSPTSSPSSSQIHSPFLTPWFDFSSLGAPDDILDQVDTELFNHYLTHTSLAVPFDVDDLYALGVGIPSLAFRSKPLMSSILALAAVCKSHDLLGEPHPDKKEILDLLILADRHHRTALVQIQLDLPNPCQYDYVLANATVMVLYASASHCVRIRLAETQTKDEPLPRELVSTQSQWISLIRAAHLAFVGLLNDRSEHHEIAQENINIPSPSTLPPSNEQSVCLKEVISPENGPTERTKELFFPIVAASSGSALNVLRAKAQTIWKAEGHSSSWTKFVDPKNVPHLRDSSSANLHACLSSLDILGDIITEGLSATPPAPSSASYSNHIHAEPDSPSLGRLSTVSDWLRSYVARVTSATTAPRPLRRVIMAFLNRVPAEYLNIVQTTLESIDMPIGTGQGDAWESSGVEFSNLSTVHKLAIDIFAHWLVLVMLLDGVWWIGGIGAWELRRVVSFVRAEDWHDSSSYSEEYWWPESMNNIGRELRESIKVD